MTRTAWSLQTTLQRFAILLLSIPLVCCAINPATGKRQLMLVSESQEIAMGKENDPAIVAQFGLYDDDELQRYVDSIGQKLAAGSERPHLEWTFRVLDDTLVNAFALPGGYIYVTRGILAHFDSEAELASVLGHEIGHVTARHSANQMSKAQLAQFGLGAGAAMASDNLQSLVDVANMATQLAFLKFSRDDERQADDLGLRYIVKNGYDPRPMGDVFLTLKRVGEASGGSGPPNWMSTHPDPENREGRISDQVAQLNRDFTGSTINRDRYLEQIDGIVFGDDPRHGFFKNNVLYHPEMKFRLDFPADWKPTNARQFVVAMSPDDKAMIQLTLSNHANAALALRKFLEQGGIANARPWNRSINGLSASGSSFSATLNQGTAIGEVVFVEYDGRVYQLVGLSGEANWSVFQPSISRSLGSFQKLTDSRMLDVEPKKVRLARPGSPMTLEEFARRFDSTVDLKTLAVINGVDAQDKLEVGRAYKVVRGGKIP
jgi:predicted Zn-dependent protease